MFTGTLRADLLLGDVRSLKAKRSVVRPIIAEVKRTFAVCAAETGQLNLRRRAEVGVAVVAGDAAHCVEVLDAVERLIADHPEVDLLAARRQLFSDEDDPSSAAAEAEAGERRRDEETLGLRDPAEPDDVYGVEG